MMSKKELMDFEKQVNESPSWTAWGNQTVKDLIEHIRELEKKLENQNESS